MHTVRMYVCMLYLGIVTIPCARVLSPAREH